MPNGAARGPSELLEEDVYGKARRQSKNAGRGLNWSELLSPNNGGPGDSPGRAKAIELAEAKTAERYAAGKFKKAKGSTASKPKATVSRDQVRKAGW